VVRGEVRAPAKGGRKDAAADAFDFGPLFSDAGEEEK
jgi:hypothetical protein